MPPSTVLDALIAEMLGDVGKLHAEVASLKAATIGASEEFRAAGREAAQSMADEAAAAVSSVRQAAEAELRRVRKAAVIIGMIALLCGFAGGAAGAMWLIAH